MKEYISVWVNWVHTYYVCSNIVRLFVWLVVCPFVCLYMSVCLSILVISSLESTPVQRTKKSEKSKNAANSSNGKKQLEFKGYFVSVFNIGIPLALLRLALASVYSGKWMRERLVWAVRFMAIGQGSSQSTIQAFCRFAHFGPIQTFVLQWPICNYKRFLLYVYVYVLF